IEGQPSNDKSPSPDEEKRQISPDYFRALQTPLIKGRFFTDADNTDAPPVVIVNQAFSKKFWPKGEALGQRITFDDQKKNPKWVTIVGVVSDIHHFGLDLDPKPEMYVPFAQESYFTTIYVVRSNQDPRNLVPAIQREVRAIDSALPLANVRTFENVIADSVAPRRLSVVLLGVLAGVAVLLAGVVMYWGIWFFVVLSTTEIGVGLAVRWPRRRRANMVLD